MVLYVLISIFFIICMIYEKSVLKITYRKLWAIFLIAPLFIMNAFKDVTVGSDTSVYSSLYNIFTQESLFTGRNFSMEIGYRSINKILGLLNIDFFGFQIIYSLFIFFILFQFVVKYSKNISFSIFFFVTFRVFFFSMTGIRQMIAISIVLYSIKYIENKKPVKYIMSVILASLFHVSAIISVFLYLLPFKRFKLNFISLLKISIISLVVSIGTGYFIDIFISIFPKYNVYLYRMETYDGIFVYIQTGVILSLFLVGLVFNRKTSQYKRLDNINNQLYPINNIDVISLNAIIIGYILSVFSLNIDIANRLSNYFTIYFMIYLPNSIENIKNPKLKILVYYILNISLLIYFVLIMLYRPKWDGVIPYQFIW